MFPGGLQAREESARSVRVRVLRAGPASPGVATPAKGNLTFPLVMLATWHKPTALQSAKELRALKPKRIAPGHGKVVEDPDAEMAAAIRRAE